MANAAPSGPRNFTEETVQAKTGKSSQEWYSILDDWGAGDQGHTKTAAYLRNDHGVGGWWAQAITNRYEWERGLRSEPEMPDDLQQTLDAHPRAREAFERLPVSHRLEHIKAITEAKRPDTRTRRIEQAIQKLTE